MSINRILEKAWEDCYKEGVCLDTVYFESSGFGLVSVMDKITFTGQAVEKPQNQPDE